MKNLTNDKAFQKLQDNFSKTTQITCDNTSSTASCNEICEMLSRKEEWSKEDELLWRKCACDQYYEH